MDGVRVKDVPEIMGIEGDGTTQYKALKKYMRDQLSKNSIK